MEVEHIIWLFYRKAVQEHLDSAEVLPDESEAEYRERAEKAGLVAVVNFVARTYQKDAA